MQAAGQTAEQIEKLLAKVNLSYADAFRHPFATDSDAAIKKQLKDLFNGSSTSIVDTIQAIVVPPGKKEIAQKERLEALAKEVDQENAHAAATTKLGVISICRDYDMLVESNQQRKSPEITRVLIAVLKEPGVDQALSVDTAVKNNMKEKHNAVDVLANDPRNSEILAEAIKQWQETKKEVTGKQPAGNINDPKVFYKAYRDKLQEQKGEADPKENPLMDPAKNPLLAYAIQMKMMADAADKMDAALTEKKDAAFKSNDLWQPINTTKLITKLTEIKPVGDANIHPPAQDPQKPAQWVDPNRLALSNFIKTVEALNEALADLKTTLINTKNPESADLKAKEKAVADAHLAVAGMLQNTFTKQSLLKVIAEDDLNAVLENLARIRNTAQAALKLQLKNTPANANEMNAPSSAAIQKLAKDLANNTEKEVTVRTSHVDLDGKTHYTPIVDDQGVPIKFQKRDILSAAMKIEARIEALRRAGSDETMTITAEKDGTHTFKFSNPEREKEFIQMLKDERALRLAEESKIAATTGGAAPAIVAGNATGAPLAPTGDAVVAQEPGQGDGGPRPS